MICTAKKLTDAIGPRPVTLGRDSASQLPRQHGRKQQPSKTFAGGACNRRHFVSCGAGRVTTPIPKIDHAPPTAVWRLNACCVKQGGGAMVLIDAS